MRLRLALCAAPLLAGTYFGWTLAASARRRRELIAAHISALEFMKAEISSRLTPLPECAARLAASGPGPLRGFYLALAAALDAPCGRDFASIWGSLLDNAELPPDALAVLAELGRSLGRYDAQTQRAAIERAEDELGRILASLRERDASLDRLRVGLSAAAGALAALILY